MSVEKRCYSTLYDAPNDISQGFIGNTAGKYFSSITRGMYTVFNRCYDMLQGSKTRSDEGRKADLNEIFTLRFCAVVLYFTRVDVTFKVKMAVVVVAIHCSVVS